VKILPEYLKRKNKVNFIDNKKEEDLNRWDSQLVGHTDLTYITLQLTISKDLNSRDETVDGKQMGQLASRHGHDCGIPYLSSMLECTLLFMLLISLSTYIFWEVVRSLLVVVW
jgi:hypothetical protein